MIRHRGIAVALVGIVAVALGVSTLGPSEAHADWVVLQNGRALEGTIEEETDEIVRIRLPGGVMSLPRSSVKSVHRGDRPAEDREGDRVEHQGGAERPAVYRYLDGGVQEDGTVRLPRFTLFLPVGELAHGTLVEMKDLRTLNGVEMAKVKVGEVEGWIPAAHLREAPREPVVR